MKSIWIVSTGSRGDVQPYVAVALELQKRYKVRFFTTESLVSLPRSFGVSTTAIAPDGKEALGDNLEENPFIRGMANGNVQDLMEGVKMLNQRSAPYIRDVILEEEKQPDENLPDLCVANILALGVAWYLALKYDIPFYELGCSDSTFNPDYASGGMPTPPCQLHYYFMRYLIPKFRTDLNLPIIEALDQDLAVQLKKAPMENTLDPILRRGVMISPIIAHILHPKASPKLTFLGSTVVMNEDGSGDEIVQLEDFGGLEVYDKVNEFLNSGSSKPIYIGWGSMLCKSSEHMLDLCVRAAYASNQRAIVLGGQANLSLQMLERSCTDASIIEYARTNVLFIPKAPHEWLFSKVSLTIHHGGAGTVTAALRSGVPTIVTPVMTDQFDYAYAVNQLGNGIGLPQLHKLGWNDLSHSITKVLEDQQMSHRAVELALKVKQEDGAGAAVKAIESYWEEVGKEKGKFRSLWPGTRPPSLLQGFVRRLGLSKKDE